MIYAPLVVDEVLGIAVPIEIRTDYSQHAEPVLQLLGNSEISFAGPTGTDFANAIVKARKCAVDLLAAWNLKPAIQDFSILLGLPDLNVGPLQLQFTQGSLETPIMLALFLQHPAVQRLIPLNPEVMASGPIVEPTLGPKLLARKTVGGANRLLVAIRGGRLKERYLGGGLSIIAAGDTSAALRAYVSESDRRKLYSGLSKIIVYGTYHRWDAPLQDAKPRRGQSRPMLPLERNQWRLTEAINSSHAIQLQGMPGIGKSCLLSQWLEQEEVQARYDVILFTSLLDFGRNHEGESISKWAGSAIDELSHHLNDGRGLGLLQKGLMERPGGDERHVLKLFRNCLGDLKVLWVIDNGESLLDEDGSILEPRFQALFTFIGRREVSWDLLFVTNRKLEWPEGLLEILELSEGFTRPEAQEYLRLAEWPYPTLIDDVVRLLGGHPRALALLAGLAKNKRLHQAEIYDILERLPEGGGSDLRQKMCEIILDITLDSVQRHAGQSAWWSLLESSTFLQNFSLREVQNLRRSTPKGVARGHLAQDLQALDQRSLLNWDGERWWMHRLLRGYLQDRFHSERPREFELCHRLAGEYYFPLHDGRAHSTPVGIVRERYSDAAGCAAAFYHFETAGYEKGQRAIIENVYEHAIPRVQWLMQFGRRPSNPNYGYWAAERILRKVLKVYADAEGEDSGTGARNVSFDINYLMAKALYSQNRSEKLEEALLHCREAVNKGSEDAITLLVCILCDVSRKRMTEDSPVNEAITLFERVRGGLKAGVLKSTEFLGQAYEKIAYDRWLRSQLNGEEPTAALDIINEAAAHVRWDRIYLLAADIAALKGSQAEEERWLRFGLDQVPQSNPIWNRLFIMAAQNDSLVSIPEHLRRRPRGIHSCLALCKSLLVKGLVTAAKQCIDDGLQNYPASAELWVYLGKVLEAMPAIHKDRARLAYKRAIDLNPASANAYLSLANLEKTLGNKEEAIKSLESGCEKCTNDCSVPLALAVIYEEEARGYDAEGAYRLAVRKSHGDGAAYLALASFQERSGDIGSARESLKLGCEKGNDGVCHLHLAVKQFGIQNLTEAIATCELGVAKFDNDPILLMCLGRLYDHVGRSKDAAACYGQIIEFSPHWGAPYVRLANFHQTTGNYEAALKTLRLGQVRSTDVNLPAAIGQLYERMGDPVRAEETYRAGMKHLLALGAPYIALARLQESRNEIQGALETLKQGCQAAPGDGNVHAALGQFYERMGDPVRAEETYRAGMKQLLTSGAPYIALGRLQESQNETQGALETLKQGCQAASSDGNVPAALGRLYERMGDPVRAEEAYRAARIASLRNPEAAA
jgi:tetratricopeptide (TPR) repeat protein